jgi:hypothetical protein
MQAIPLSSVHINSRECSLAYSSYQLLRVFTFSFLLCVSSASNATSTSKIHTVNVGEDGTSRYNPDTVYADLSDVVVFKFFPTNHSVIRGEYTESSACDGEACNPCVPYELLHPDQQGFHSGNIETQVIPSNTDVVSLAQIVRMEPNI